MLLNLKAAYKHKAYRITVQKKKKKKNGIHKWKLQNRIVEVTVQR